VCNSRPGDFTRWSKSARRSKGKQGKTCEVEAKPFLPPPSLKSIGNLSEHRTTYREFNWETWTLESSKALELSARAGLLPVAHAWSFTKHKKYEMSRLSRWLQPRPILPMLLNVDVRFTLNGRLLQAWLHLIPSRPWKKMLDSTDSRQRSTQKKNAIHGERLSNCEYSRNSDWPLQF
jgi:hypothetical protein